MAEIEEKIINQGDKMTDITVIGKLKHSITSLKNEILSIDIRTGVVSNTLLHSKLYDKSGKIDYYDITSM